MDRVFSPLPSDMSIPLSPYTQTVFGIRSPLDSKPYYSNLALGCENTLNPTWARIGRDWRCAMIGRLVPKDWDAAGFKTLVSNFDTLGTHQESISRAQVKTR